MRVTELPFEERVSYEQMRNTAKYLSLRKPFASFQLYRGLLGFACMNGVTGTKPFNDAIRALRTCYAMRHEVSAWEDTTLAREDVAPACCVTHNTALEGVWDMTFGREA